MVTMLKMHYDGWLALPAGLRQELGLKGGDRLQAELVSGAVVLRPAAAVRGQAEPEAQASEPRAAVPALSSVETATPGRRKSGRPRKAPAVEPGADMVSGIPDDSPAPAKRKPGRPRKVRAAEEPEPVAAPVSGAGELWKLRRKAELPAAEADDQMTAPDRRPERVRFDTGYEREERHPFRHVEVRELGPRRAHNRTRQRTMG